MSEGKGQGLQIIVKRPRLKFVVETTEMPNDVSFENIFGIKGPRDPVEVAAHQEKYKLAAICARCNHWYRGRDRNEMDAQGGPKCAPPSPCGGMVSDMGYPSYEGPLTEEDLRTKCAICFEDAGQHVETLDGHKTGYCDKHLKDMIELKKAIR